MKAVFFLLLCFVIVEASELQNTKLQTFIVNKKACTENEIQGCTKYLIFKFNKDNNLYSSIQKQEYIAKTRLVQKRSPEDYTKKIKEEAGEAASESSKSADANDAFLKTSSLESLAFSKQELEYKRTFEILSRASDMNIINLKAIVGKIKIKEAILSLRFYGIYAKESARASQ